MTRTRKDLARTSNYIRLATHARRWMHARLGFVAALFLTAGFAVVRAENVRPDAATSEPAMAAPDVRTAAPTDLDGALGQLALANSELDYLRAVIQYSSRYAIGADLARTIMDVSSAEGIDPELAFRLVHVESGFAADAESPVGALGLTQLMFKTARYFDASLTRAKLLEPRTNLHIGLRYLHSLIADYDGDLSLALLAYNRGPARVDTARLQGRNPTNGYERAILTGYQGHGLLR